MQVLKRLGGSPSGRISPLHKRLLNPESLLVLGRRVGSGTQRKAKALL